MLGLVEAKLATMEQEMPSLMLRLRNRCICWCMRY